MNPSLFDKAEYSVKKIINDENNKNDEYLEILESSYEPLGFLKPDIYPNQNAICHGLYFNEDLEGIFSINTIYDIGSHELFGQIPLLSQYGNMRVAEIKNVILKRRVRGTIALGIMLYAAAKYAMENNYAAVVGITRYQTLPYFVDFGVVPICHEPLHLMGDENINDFVIYFDTCKEDSINYMHARADHFFRNEFVMARIRSKCSNKKNQLN